ncbi:MAG: hypothetical protein AAF597_11985, partial [Bacteroidota bacterium]
MRQLLFLLVSILFTSCAAFPVRSDMIAEPQRTLTESDEIIVVNQYERVPESSQFLGTLRSWGSGFFAPCSYEEVMDQITSNARQQGANVVRILRTRHESNIIRCPSIKVALYRNEDQAAITKYLKQHEALNKSSLPEEAQYAEVHFYRPNVFEAWAFGWTIQTKGEKIGKLKNNRKLTYRTTDFGPRFFGINGPLTASLLSNISHAVSFVEVDVQPGQEYYLVFSPWSDSLSDYPGLRLVNNYVGRFETENIPTREEKKAK